MAFPDSLQRRRLAADRARVGDPVRFAVIDDGAPVVSEIAWGLRARGLDLAVARMEEVAPSIIGNHNVPPARWPIGV